MKMGGFLTKRDVITSIESEDWRDSVRKKNNGLKKKRTIGNHWNKFIPPYHAISIQPNSFTKLSKNRATGRS